MRKSIPFLLLIFLFYTFLFSQERGREIVVRTTEGETIKLYKECHALVIGVSDYQSGWPKLPNAAGDADEVGDLLASLGFEVKRVKNPTKDELTQALDDFVFGPGQQKDNCLVIFFAGHGYTERKASGKDMGYIVPKDAPSPMRDKAGFRRKAIDMQDIQGYAMKIDAKHALFIFDCCFSGAIFYMAREIPPINITYKTGEQVRQFITAGEADELVPDKSIFKSQLIEALRGEADRNNDGYIIGTELGEFLQEKVIIYSNNSQHPQYGKIRDPILDKGDFVFVLESKPLPPPPIEPVIRDSLKAAQEAYLEGNYPEGIKQAKKVLNLDPNNAKARELLKLANEKIARAQINALVHKYVQSLNNNNLVEFYRDTCSSQFYSEIKKHAELISKSFNSFHSVALNIDIRLKGNNQAEVSFYHTITGTNKSGVRQVLFKGIYKWDLEKQGDSWKITGLTIIP